MLLHSLISGNISSCRIRSIRDTFTLEFGRIPMEQTCDLEKTAFLENLSRHTLLAWPLKKGEVFLQATLRLELSFSWFDEFTH